MEFWLLLVMVIGIAGFVYLKARIHELERRLSILNGEAVDYSASKPQPFRPIQSNATNVAPPPSNASTPAASTPDPVQSEANDENDPSSSDEQPSSNDNDDNTESLAEAIRSNATTSSSDTIEQTFGTKWIVWLGGLMLALGGIFLVRYAANEGYFNPGVRIFLGALLAIGLLAFGEKLRRSPIMSDIANLPNTAIPPIVTSVGIITAFATAYSAYALYNMLSPGAAFLLLAVVSLASVLLAVVHGPFLGALGVLGSFATPAMVSSEEPSVILLFAYLTFVTIAIISMVRLREWWRLGFFALAGVVLWSLTGIFFLDHGDTTGVLSIFLPVMTVLFSFVAPPKTGGGEKNVDPRWFLKTSAIFAFGLLIALLIFREGYPLIGLMSLGAFAAAGMSLFYRDEAMKEAFLFSVGIVILSLLAWVPVQDIPFGETDAASRGALTPPALPTELEFYTGVLALFGGVYAIVSYWLLPKVINRGLWASVSATVPIVLLAIVYWRSTALETSMAWGFIAGLLAIPATFAAISSRAEERGSDGAVGAYATAALAALAMGLAMVLRDAWLTASLSLLLVGLTWVNASLALPLLRWLALIIAGIVTWRLTLNPSLVLYEISPTPVFNLLIYAYAVPAAAMATTAIWMRRQKDDIIVQCLEAGAALLLTLFVSFEIHHWLSNGDMFSRKYEFGERAIQTITWLALSYFYYALGRRTGRVVLVYAGAALRWLGLAHLLLAQLLFGNPIVTGAFVGNLFVFNLLALAYLGPVIFTGLYYRAAKSRNDRPTTLLFGASSLVLGLMFITLQIRHVFHGGVLTVGETTDLEWYCYSIIWLLSGVVLFGTSFLRGGRDLRIAGILVITFAAAKGFLFDMSGLTGLLRAASFIGFGAVLIGIGLLYQKFIFPPKKNEEVRKS